MQDLRTIFASSREQAEKDAAKEQTKKEKKEKKEKKRRSSTTKELAQVQAPGAGATPRGTPNPLSARASLVGRDGTNSLGTSSVVGSNTLTSLTATPVASGTVGGMQGKFLRGRQYLVRRVEII